MTNKTSLWVLVGGIGVALLGSWLLFPQTNEQRGDSAQVDEASDERRIVRAKSKLVDYDPRGALELQRAIKARGLRQFNAPKITPPAAQPEAKKARYDGYLLTALGMPALASAPSQDALGPAGPRVDLEHESGKWIRASVDLDRDGNWDEKWSVVQGVVQRKVSSQDNAAYDKEVHFLGGHWTLPPGAPFPAKASENPGTAAAAGAATPQ